MVLKLLVHQQITMVMLEHSVLVEIPEINIIIPHTTLMELVAVAGTVVPLQVTTVVHLELELLVVAEVLVMFIHHRPQPITHLDVYLIVIII